MGFLEVWDRTEKADHPRQSGKWRDTDHRRDQCQVRRTRTPAPVRAVEGIFQRECTTIRIADQDQGLVGTNPLPHAPNTDADGRQPVLPGRQWSARRAQCRAPASATPHRNSRVPSSFPDRAHAVRRVGETVNQHCPSGDLAGRHDLVGPVGVPAYRDGCDRLRVS